MSHIFSICNTSAYRFSKFAYHAIVCETDELENDIMTLAVQDDDIGVDGIVDVSIISGNWNDTFDIRYYVKVSLW